METLKLAGIVVSLKWLSLAFWASWILASPAICQEETARANTSGTEPNGPTAGQTGTRHQKQVQEAMDALRSRPREAITLAETALSELADLSQTDQAWLHWIKGSALAMTHQSKQAFDELKLAESLCRSLGEKKLLRRTLRYLAAVAYELGEFGMGAAAAKEGLAISQELGDTSSYVGILQNELAGNLSRLRRLEEALDAFLSAFQIAQANSDKKLEAMVLTNLATFYDELGLSSGTLDLMRKAAETARTLNLPLVEATANVNLGAALLEAKDLESAETTLKTARQQALTLQAIDLMATVDSHLGDLYVAKDQLAVARAHFTHALDAFTRLENKEGISLSRQRLIALASPANSNDLAISNEQAINELQDLLEKSEAGGSCGEQISILEQLVRILELENRWPDANQALRRLDTLRQAVNRAALSSNLERIQKELEQSKLAAQLNKSELSQFMQAANVSRQRQTIWILVGGLFLSFAGVAALAILLRNNQFTLGRLRATQRELELQRERQQALDLRLSEQVRAESLSVLTAGVAHDFNNLLTGILGLAELAILEESESMKDEYLSQISATSIQAAELTRQLSLCIGQPARQTGVSEITSVVEAAKGLLAGVARSNAPLEFRGGDEELWANVGEANLRQVLVNLVANAADATENHEFVEVHVGRKTLNRDQLDQLICGSGAMPGEFCFLSLVDHGCGMSYETQARIFDPYFTTKNRGRGLGLASVQGIVKAARGALEVRSELGQGTTITIFFPSADQHQIDFALSQPVPVCELNRNGRQQAEPVVLVVDDDDIIRESFATILRCYHFQVQKAASIQEAIDVAEQLGSDLACVITDYSMPFGSGTTLAAKLKKKNPALSILVCSGFALEDVTSDPNVTCFLQKPFTPTVLVDAIRDCLAKSTPAARNE